MASYSIVTIRPDLTKCHPKYLLYALQSPTTLGQAVGGVRAIAQPDLGIKSIRSFTIPCPPVEQQAAIAHYLDQISSMVTTLKRQQSEGARELDALLPSVLDKAFRGEL